MCSIIVLKPTNPNAAQPFRQNHVNSTITQLIYTDHYTHPDYTISINQMIDLLLTLIVEHNNNKKKYRRRKPSSSVISQFPFRFPIDITTNFPYPLKRRNLQNIPITYRHFVENEFCRGAHQHIYIYSSYICLLHNTPARSLSLN